MNDHELTVPVVYAIVLAWNHSDDTREAITSLLASSYPNLHIAIVNNGSTDDTLQMLDQEFPQVEVISSPTNLGVSGGYNLGIQHALVEEPEYILIANNDIAVDRDMISKLVENLSQNPRNGIAMPKIYHYGDRKKLWCTGGHWRKFPPTVKMTDLDTMENSTNSQAKLIEFAPSCVLLLRVSVVQEIGFFDTGYFFYFDDWDYSRRVVAAGYKIAYVPDAVMWHKISASTQKSDKPAIWWYRMGWSAGRYYLKFHTRRDLFLFALWFMIRELAKGKPFRSVLFLSGVREYTKQQKTVKNDQI